MLVHIRNEVFELSNEPDVVNKISQLITRMIEKENLILNSLIVDGQEVLNDYWEFITDNLDMIKKVQIILHTQKEALDEYFISAKDYLNRAIPAVVALSNKFYQGPTSEDWEQFEQLSEGLQWTTNFVNKIESSKELYFSWKLPDNIYFDISAITNKLNQSLEERDYILLADLLRYEVVPILETIKNVVDTTYLQEIENKERH